MNNLLLILLLFAFSPSFSQTGENKPAHEPINLEEAVAQLKILHTDSTKQEILSMTEDEFLANAHMGLGMWMRNNWGLWGKKKLAGYFHSIGIHHPDDMSSIVLTSYYRELQGQAWKLDEQVALYQDYWDKMNGASHPLETDSVRQK